MLVIGNNLAQLSLKLLVQLPNDDFIGLVNYGSGLHRF